MKSVTVAGVLVLGGGVTRCWGASWLMLGELTFPRSAGRQTRGSCHQPGGSEQGDGDSPPDVLWFGSTRSSLGRLGVDDKMSPFLV